MDLWLLNTPLYILIKRLLWICDYYTPLNILIKTTTMNLWLLYTTLYTNINEYYEFVITIQHLIYLKKRLLWICDYYAPFNILIKTTTMDLWLLYTT